MKPTTKREAENAAREYEGAAEGHLSDAEWLKDRGFQPESIRVRRAAADCHLEAARLRALLPTLLD